jgi:hypothetical protein
MSPGSGSASLVSIVASRLNVAILLDFSPVTLIDDDRQALISEVFHTLSKTDADTVCSRTKIATIDRGKKRELGAREALLSVRGLPCGARGQACKSPTVITKLIPRRPRHVTNTSARPSWTPFKQPENESVRQKPHRE